MASGYTSDAALTNFINNTYTPFANNVGTAIDSKAETWYQSADPSSSWNTTALKDAHVGDLWYNLTADSDGHTHTYIYRKLGSAYTWSEISGVPSAVFDTIDGKAAIYTAKPTSYNKNDLWFLEAAYTLNGVALPAGTVVVAVASSSSFQSGHWVKKDRYTDDSAISDFNYLKIALLDSGGNMEVSGGLMLGSFIGVKDSTNDKVVAGMNASDALGKDGTYGRLMMFAGADGADRLATAKYRVYETGHLYAEDAEIHGDIYVGSTTGRRVQISSGDYGSINLFDSGNNVTTHIGNDYCSSIAAFNTSSTGNSPYIPSSNGSSGGTTGISVSYSGSGDTIPLVKDKYYTSRYFTVSGDQSANVLSGTLTLAFSGTSGYAQMDNYHYIDITLYRNSSGTGEGIQLMAAAFYNSWTSQTITINKVLPAGTYYLFLSSSGGAYKEGATGNKTITLSITGGTFTVTPIAQRLQIFANGLGYRYNEYQYAALLRETSSYTGSGDLAFKMRTGTSSNVVGVDIVPSGLKLYGPVRTLLGSTTSMSTTSSTTITNPKNYSFLEIVAKFNSGAETVSMLMPVATWLGATSASNAICISTDSRYVLVYKYSDTAFRIANNSGCYSVAFYGIL